MATENRLIDANALKALFDERYDDAFIQMYARLNKEYWDGVCGGVNWGRNTITDAPSVDAVEVVRCKDCKHWSYIPGIDKCPHCTVFCSLHSKAYTTKPYDFCSYGERKENEQT